MMTETETEKTFDRRVHLKVKIKSLAVEAKIIRHEERRAKARARSVRASEEARKWASHELTSLQYHRRWGVRKEARHSQLAYAFIRGTAYRTVEPKVREGNEPDWKQVASIAARFRRQSAYVPQKDQTQEEVKAWSEV